MNDALNAADGFADAANRLGDEIIDRDNAVNPEQRYSKLNRDQRVIWGNKADPRGVLQNPAMTGLPARSRPSTKVGEAQAQLIYMQARIKQAEIRKDAFLAGAGARVAGGKLMQTLGTKATGALAKGMSMGTKAVGAGARGAVKGTKGILSARRGLINQGGVSGAVKRSIQRSAQGLQQRGVNNSAVNFAANINPNARRTLMDNAQDVGFTGWTAASDYNTLANPYRG